MGPASAISPTAHYTGYAWVRAGLSDPALATSTGRALHDSLLLPFTVARRLGLSTVDAMLVGRHLVIDDLLTRAIDDGAVGQVVEMAGGLSQRGWRFARRYGAGITYIEADLAAMAATKAERLRPLGTLGDHHRVVTMDALVDDGPNSLRATTADLDRSRGLAIITEGLVNYLALPDLTTMWGRFAAVADTFAHGLYLSDIGLKEGNRDPLVAIAGGVLSAFVRRRTSLHFADGAAAGAAMLAAGFASARLHQPERHPATASSGRDPGMRRIRVIEAHTA